MNKHYWSTYQIANINIAKITAAGPIP